MNMDQISNNIKAITDAINAGLMTQEEGKVILLGKNYNPNSYYAIHKEELIKNAKPIVYVKNPFLKLGMGCSHKWKSYIGFTKSYEYCEKCDEKKEL